MSSSIFAWASRSKGSAVRSLILSCSLLARSCCCSSSTLVKRSEEKHSSINRLISPFKKKYKTCDALPKSPLNRASASGGFRSFRSESSCGLDNSICWSKAGSSIPWGEDPRKAIGVEGFGARCCVGCCCGLIALRWLVEEEEEVPGTVMERKSIWGRPTGQKGQRMKIRTYTDTQFWLKQTK